MKRFILLLANGFEEVEAITCVDYLRRMNFDVQMVSLSSELDVEGAHSIKVRADVALSDLVDTEHINGVIVPGGMMGVEHLYEDHRVRERIAQLHERGALIAAICAGPIVLYKSGILEGKKVTCYPGLESELPLAEVVSETTVQDQNILTSRGPATAVDFVMAIAGAMGEDALAKRLAESILW